MDEALGLRSGRFVASDAAQESFPITLIEGDTAAASSTHRGSTIGPTAVQARGAVVDNRGSTNAFLCGQPYGTVSCSSTVDVDLVLFIAAGVLCGSGAEYTVRHADDHAEPYNGQALERQEEGQEDPLDGTVHADGVFQAAEGSEHVREGVRVAVGADVLGSRS